MADELRRQVRGLIDVNEADEEELAELDHVGPDRARKIVAYRERHGPFRSLDDLIHVEGFSERLIETLAPDLTVGTPEEHEPV